MTIGYRKPVRYQKAGGKQLIQMIIIGEKKGSVTFRSDEIIEHIIKAHATLNFATLLP